MEIFFYIFISTPTKNKIQNTQPISQTTPLPTNQNIQTISPFTSPISNALGRITKKPFGIYVTPKNSPVSPEKFTGFHTGVDFETLPSEANTDVPIYAICGGKLLISQFGKGYGGMLVESCTLDKNPITVIYGHIKLTSVKAKIGDHISSGEFLANLGTGYSSETGGERKHLHLGIHKGTTLNTSGYIANKSMLSNWIDFEQYLK